MKKKLSLFFVMVFAFATINAQSFVYPPKIKLTESFPVEGDAYIVFKDNRTFDQNLKEKKCSSADLIKIFKAYINESFPKLNIIFLAEEEYDNFPKKNSITYKIELKKYDATFYSGNYVSKTLYSLEIYDFRNQKNLYKFNFEGDRSQFNVMGHSSGKKASNRSFEKAYNEFIQIVYKGQTNKLEPQEHDLSNNSSQSVRLIELKKLFDLEILTQEEFDTEKAKILSEK